MTYAKDTTVAPERSRAEIERALTQHGATSFAYGWERDGSATLGFEAAGRRVRFQVPMPPASEFAKTPTGKRRTQNQAEAEREKEHRRRWRALLLVIKAKLEAAESGISTFEDEFLAHIIVPTADGATTVGQWLRPQIAGAYETGRPVALLPPAGET